MSKRKELGVFDQWIVVARGEGVDLLERDFSLVKKKGSRLCRSDDNKKKRASSVALALRLSTRSAVLAIGAVEEVD